MSDDLTVAYLAGWHKRDDVVRVMKKRIEALEAENREMAMQLLATDGQAQEALERAVKAEADVTRAIKTALEMAAKVGDKCERQNGPLARKRFDEKYQKGVGVGGRAVASGIRAIRVEDVLKNMEGEP